MLKNLKINIGADDYRALVSIDGIKSDPTCLVVDKSKFIVDFIKLVYKSPTAHIETNAQVLLITRPRRWGKTLTLSMLQHFLASEVDGKPTKELFNGTYIQDQPEFAEQGQWPVIFISFKDLKGRNFQEIFDNVAEKLVNLFKQYMYIIKALREKSGNFSTSDPGIVSADLASFEAIINKQANKAALENSLKFLSELLFAYHNKQVYILIDEYDNAINHAFDDPVLLKELIGFFSNLLSSALKTNNKLKKGLITGILRVAKANIFSGLSNLVEYSVLDPGFNEYYGFSEAEVALLLQKAGIDNATEIKNWYNGYHMGGRTVYNPWSIMNCIYNAGRLEPYWANSGDPAIIKDLWLYKSQVEDKIKIRTLIREGQVTLNNPLDKLVSLEDLQVRPESLWSLLLHTGYLTQNNANAEDIVLLPNQEIKLLLKKQIDNWCIENPALTRIANTLLVGDVEGFVEALRSVMHDPALSARIFGGGGNAANWVDTIKVKEFMYQFLVMTELRCINSGQSAKCEVIAEPEFISGGSTRPDFVVINHERKLCVVGELKAAARNVDDDGLDEIAQTKALSQAKTNQYGIKFLEKGYELLQIGLAFRGGRLGYVYELVRPGKNI